MSRAAPTFYVLHGDDEFSRKAEVQAMRSRMGDPAMAELNTATFDGRTATVADVLAAASALPFLSDKRLIIVEGMLAWLTRKGAGKAGKAELEMLAAALSHLPDTARLVFVESETLPETHPILKIVHQEPRGFAKAFNPPRDPTNWIVRQVEQYGGKIEGRAAEALALAVNADLRAADSECFKLITFVGTERPITEADIALLTPHVANVAIWDMVDALGKRDGQTAARLMHRLLEDNEPLSLLGMINRQFRLILQAREVLNAGGTKRDLMKIPELSKDFVATKIIAQAQRFTLDQLEVIYRHLLELDHSIKTSRINGDLALDLLVASVAE